MSRRWVTYLVLGVLFAVSTGATGAIHHLCDDHHGGAPADCQTCHFIKIAATAVIVASVLIVCLRDQRPLHFPTSVLIPARRLGHGSPAGPRAPPRF